MLRKITEGLIMTILIVVVMGIYFRFIGPVPFSVNQTTTTKAQTFDVTGSGKVSVVPDEAVVSLGVKKQGGTVGQAQSAANTTIKQLTSELAKIGISEKNIQTNNYSVYPDYAQNDYRTIVGYSVNASLSVKVTEGQFEKIEKVIDLAGTLGLEQVSGLYFQLSDESRKKALVEARKMAVEEAKQKAENLAGLAEIRLGKIINVKEGGVNSVSPMYTSGLQMATMEVGGGMSTKVSAGTSDVNIEVTLSYETR